MKERSRWSNILIIIYVFILLGINCKDEIKYENGLVTFEYVDNENYKVTIKAKLNSWLGIGYGKGMINTDMNVAEFISNSEYSLKDSYSKGYKAPEEDISLGGTDDLKNVNFSIDEDGNGILTFTRALNTGDNLDKNLELEKSEDLILAWGSGKISYHGRNHLSTSFKITQGNIDPPAKPFDFFEFHGIILIILWVPLNFIGYISARFLRQYTWWIWLHFAGSGSAAFITIGVLAASLKYATPIRAESPEVINLHKILGIIILAFVVIQTVFGLVQYFVIYFGEIKKDSIHKAKIVHKYVGMGLTLIVYISLITGFIIEWEHLVYILKYLFIIRVIPAVLCGVFLNIILVLEIIFWISNSFKKIDYIQELITETSNSGKNLPSLNLPQLNSEKDKKKFVLYENYVCDVGNYISSHPGGSNLLQDNLYLDVSRYVTGTQAYSGNFNPYSHNYITHKHIITKLAYAEIKDNHGIISLNNNSVILGRHNINNYFSYISEENCFLGSKTIVAENIIEFQFLLKNYSVARILPEINWIGRHFAVSSRKLNKTRYYSLSMCLNPFMKERHMALIGNIYRLEKGEELVNINLAEKDLKSNYLNLYIKKYPFKNGLSKYVHELPANTKTDLVIRGPLGVGLNLFENKLKGVHVILAAGTGVIPFLDLVAYVLRYATYKISKEKFGNTTNVLLPQEIQIFDQIKLEEFQIHFYVSFRDSMSALFLDVCEELNAVDKKYGLGIFKFFKTIQFENNMIWDSNFLISNFNSIKDEIKQFYIVGPITFMQDIKQGLIDSKISTNEKIFLV